MKNILRSPGPLLLLAWLGISTPARAETVSIVTPTNAAPRVQFGAEKLSAALKGVGVDAPIVHAAKPDGQNLILTKESAGNTGREGFHLRTGANNDRFILAGDDSGLLYGSLELAKRIQAEGKLPLVDFSDQPAFVLRGTCIGMQKTFILPGRKVYEYPYTPDLFPFFYDKKFWQEYLDFLVENRMNTLYLWNGHPFASLVKLPDYPYAVEVPDDVFAQNVAMFRYVTQECDKRGIWLVQMFYNIIVSKPFAEHNNLPSTQFAASTPLVADYTRKSIAEFVKQYPNVGLMVCLGEALQGTPNQIEWATKTILPGVHDGMAAAHLTQEPPVVIRTHAMDAKSIMPPAYEVYSNLFTETKFNGESLTTWEPRGKGQATHLAMSKLGAHLVNIHILSNLEPFRYGDQQFIQKSMQASRDRLGASGVHLYPLSYWNWPDAPDIASPPLKQWERDWIWFEAWARYAWNPDVPAAADRAYWIGRLTSHFGNEQAAAAILEAYNASGECAPRLIRRFGITEGNRQTLALGMTLDQLVHPEKYSVLPDLWESQSPPGERIQDYIANEVNHKEHVGETPPQIIQEVLDYAQKAVDAANQAAAAVTTNRAEFERLRNDMNCIQAMTQSYAAKANAAMLVLRYNYSNDPADMEKAAGFLAESFKHFQRLTELTEPTYHYANSMQTSQRKIPAPGGTRGMGTNYHWTQLVARYKTELEEFQATVAGLHHPNAAAPTLSDLVIKPLPSAAFKLISANAETYLVKPGAPVFSDQAFAIRNLAPELHGLTGIRFAHAAAAQGKYEPVEFETTGPVTVLVGYFQSKDAGWLQVPNLETAAHADDRGGLDPVIQNAAAIDGCPAVNVHAFRFGAGRQKLEMIGSGSFVVLGIIPESAKISKRDARLMIQPK